DRETPGGDPLPPPPVRGPGTPGGSLDAPLGAPGNRYRGGGGDLQLHHLRDLESPEAPCEEGAAPANRPAGAPRFQATGGLMRKVMFRLLAITLSAFLAAEVGIRIADLVRGRGL